MNACSIAVFTKGDTKRYSLVCLTGSSSLSQNVILYSRSVHFTLKHCLFPLTRLIQVRFRLPFQIAVSRVTEAVALAPVKYRAEKADDSSEARLQSPLFID